MGALAAVLGPEAVADERTVRRMLRAVRHRGTGAVVARLDGCTLGIVDGDGQASLARSEGLAAAVVGVIDEALGLVPDGPAAPGTAAELCLAAFRQFGSHTPDRLRGAFAALVTDGARVWCWRDHVGFEPLFYRHSPAGLLVGSEAKQIVAGDDAPSAPDIDLIEHYFYGEDWDDTACALRGVRRVLGGHLLEADARRSDARRYWEPRRLLETAGRLSRDEVAERFTALMAQAARRAVTGRDAIALSGGIDSPAVAAFAAPAHLERSGHPLTAISEIYPDFPSCDESHYIEQVADHLDLPLYTYEPQPQRLDRLQHWVRAFDGPWSIWSPDGAAERYRQARDKGFRTLLTGELAEQVVETRRYLLQHLIQRGRVRAAWRHARQRHASGVRLRRQARQVAAALAPRWVEARHRLRAGSGWYVPPWLDAERLARRDASYALPARHRWAAHQVAAFTGVGLSAEANALCQARHGVRVRMPWADIDLWGFFLSLPAEVKHPDLRTKSLVRDLLRGRVPDSILDRRDKTIMNDWFAATGLDHAGLRRWLSDDSYRVPGIDYRLLRERLETEQLSLPEFLWAKDLAAVHAFVSLW